MYGAVLRRSGRIKEAEKVFHNALGTPKQSILKNNFTNLLIDIQAFEAESTLKAVLKDNPNYEDAKKISIDLNFSGA